jgi:hypothetical protein
MLLFNKYRADKQLPSLLILDYCANRRLKDANF